MGRASAKKKHLKKSHHAYFNVKNSNEEKRNDILNVKKNDEDPVGKTRHKSLRDLENDEGSSSKRNKNRSRHTKQNEESPAGKRNKQKSRHNMQDDESPAGKKNKHKIRHSKPKDESPARQKQKHKARHNKQRGFAELVLGVLDVESGNDDGSGSVKASKSLIRKRSSLNKLTDPDEEYSNYVIDDLTEPEIKGSHMKVDTSHKSLPVFSTSSSFNGTSDHSDFQNGDPEPTVEERKVKIFVNAKRNQRKVQGKTSGYDTFGGSDLTNYQLHEKSTLPEGKRSTIDRPDKSTIYTGYTANWRLQRKCTSSWEVLCMSVSNTLNRFRCLVPSWLRSVFTIFGVLMALHFMSACFHTKAGEYNQRLKKPRVYAPYGQ